MAPTPKPRIVSPRIASPRIVSQPMFEIEPMGDKPVSELHGIGPVYAKRLSDRGYDKATVVFGQYLVLKKNEDLFVEWMDIVAGVPKVHAKAAYDCLDKWFHTFVV